MTKIKTPQNPPGPPPAEAKIDPRFQLLLTLISLLKSVRHKDKVSELEFMIVNQTFNLVPYRSCVYWQWSDSEASVRSASGLVQIDPHGPYALWLCRLVSGLMDTRKWAIPPEAPGDDKKPAIRAYANVHPVTAADCPEAEAADWRNWSAAHALMICFRNEQEKLVGGLWMDRDEEFNDLERAFLEDLCDAYAQRLTHLDKAEPGRKSRQWWKSLFSISRTKIRIVLLALVVVMLLPVRMSVSAPAEIVAREPYVVSVPFEGIIKSVEVMPGQEVKKGDILIRMDSTMLKNKSEMAAKEMETAIVALTKTEREAFTDRSKLAEISMLKSQVEQKSAEKTFSDELLAKAEIRAERDGIAIFGDVNALRGKPVQTGEQVMLLADPNDSELLIRVPVDAMIAIERDIPATFFLNVSPLAFSNARYESIGYQATPDPDGLLTYKVRARFDESGARPRIGWTGTGKVYGKRTIMAFNVLRRPIVTLRRKLGI